MIAVKSLQTRSCKLRNECSTTMADNNSLGEDCTAQQLTVGAPLKCINVLTPTNGIHETAAGMLAAIQYPPAPAHRLTELCES